MERGISLSCDVKPKRPTPIVRDAETLFKRGIDALEREHLEEAAGLLRQASELVPGQAPILLALGIALGRLLKIPEALQALESAVELEPTGFFPRFRLGELYMRIGVPARAQEELRRAMDLSVTPEQRKMVRELMALDAKRAQRRIWRPDFGLPRRRPK